MTKVIYPGSLDPITVGHMEVIERAKNAFDGVVVAIMINPAKKDFLFTQEERLEMIQEIYKDEPKVKVVADTGYTVDVALREGCTLILRGIRNVKDEDKNVIDYEYERNMAEDNKKYSNGEIDTVSLFANPEYDQISSSFVKREWRAGNDIEAYVHPVVKEKMLMKRR